MDTIFDSLRIQESFVLLWMILGLVGLAGTVFWLVMLVDAIRREFNDSTMKLVWVLVLVFTHTLGALIYYFLGRPTGRIPS
ncbi:MAG: PLD nuclease N-terminal domain-containing protein [Armatimonadota bacterium]